MSQEINLNKKYLKIESTVVRVLVISAFLNQDKKALTGYQFKAFFDRV